jgi:hypothetical protein
MELRRYAVIPEREIQERLYQNRVLLLEAERERLFRAAYQSKPGSNLFRLALAYLGKGLIWIGTWLEAHYDCYALKTADRSC